MSVGDDKKMNCTSSRGTGSNRGFTRPGVVTQYVLLALTWGSSFFFVSVGLEGLSPAQVVLARLTIGAVALIVVRSLMRQPLPRGVIVWCHLIVVGLLLCVIPFLLFAWAQQHVPSSIASIINATTPLMTMIVALAALPSERPDRWRIGGLFVGFCGVLLVLAPWQSLGSSGTPVGYVACLIATLSYGVAFVYMRRFVSPLGLPAISTATVQVSSAAAIMLLISPWIAAQPLTLAPPVVTSMVLLGVLGTGLAYVWNANIVSQWGATRASTVTYLAPIVGITLGVVVLGEQVGWSQPLGAAVVILGILVSQRRIKLPSKPLPRASQESKSSADNYG
jgi:drug/metabolite transporter (DMT)-like permease